MENSVPCIFSYLLINRYVFDDFWLLHALDKKVDIVLMTWYKYIWHYKISLYYENAQWTINLPLSKYIPANSALIGLKAFQKANTNTKQVKIREPGELNKVLMFNAKVFKISNWYHKLNCSKIGLYDIFISFSHGQLLWITPYIFRYHLNRGFDIVNGIYLSSWEVNKTFDCFLKDSKYQLWSVKYISKTLEGW